MTSDEYRSLLQSRLEQHYILSEDGLYSGKQYDIAAVSVVREEPRTISGSHAAAWYETKEVCLVSINCTDNFIRSELELLPQMTLSGIIPSSHHKSTTMIRVFVTDKTSWETAKMIRAFKFSRSFRMHFWGYAECQAVLVDLQGSVVYANMAAFQNKQLFSLQQEEE